ncbi:uncharacterized protein PAC_03379 [Phialocephala subalpina]|uniref:Uncharacterized protein n=1 Tax=Phialocephala subalpina TaxID=576137 RepID=A0A1L7WL46_9HELO|nr:uncharacterized protein PAC_03379 [Phialocephala subalpina]
MSVGSFTTTFTPPASCLDSFSTTTFSPSFYVAGPMTTQGCMPNNFQFSSTNYYSPGICPVGYTTACQQVNSAGTVLETVVTCCPTSYACNPDRILLVQLTYGCQSIFTSAVFPHIVVISGTIPVSTVSTTAILGAVNAFSVQIRYQSTDFQSSKSTITSTPTPSRSTTTTSTSSSGGASGGGGGISHGAAAGIGIGSAAGALFLAGAFVFMYTLGRRRRSIENPSASYGLTERNNAPINTNIVKAELPVPEMTVMEMPGHVY